MVVWVVVGVLVVLVTVCWLYYYVYWYPYTHPSSTVKNIQAMFETIVPGTGSTPIREGNESYTLNKSAITLCIKDPRTGKQYPWNTLAYVSLHELAHVVTKIKEKDPHGPQFRKNFTTILDKAARLGYYDPSVPVPDTYCST
jgi:hypothetical protein